jgi:hypothetical protein
MPEQKRQRERDHQGTHVLAISYHTAGTAAMSKDHGYEKSDNGGVGTEQGEGERIDKLGVVIGLACHQ